MKQQCGYMSDCVSWAGRPHTVWAAWNCHCACATCTASMYNLLVGEVLATLISVAVTLLVGVTFSHMSPAGVLVCRVAVTSVGLSV